MSLLEHFIGTSVLLLGNEAGMGENGMMKAKLVREYTIMRPSPDTI